MVACTFGINMQYTDPIMHVIIVHGLLDQDHQWETLGHPDQYISLDGILTLLETKEMGWKTQVSILRETGGGEQVLLQDIHPNSPWQAAGQS
jgi:hypothetical protein